MRSLTAFLFALISVTTQAQSLKLELVKTLVGHEHGVRKVVFSENAQLFASGDTRGGIRVWSVEDGAVKFSWNEHYGAILDLQFSASADKLASAGSDGQVMIFDLNTGAILERLDAPNDIRQPINNVNFCEFNQAGTAIYFGGSNTYVCKKEIGSADNGDVIHIETKTVHCADASPDGRLLTVGAGKMIITFDLQTDKILKEFNTGDCGVNALRYSADGKKLLTWCANSRVDVRNPRTLDLVTSFRSGTGARKFSNLFFTQDQRYVITGDHASRFTVWDLSNRELVLDQSTEQGTIMAFDMKEEPNYLLSGSLDKSVKLWKIVEVEEVEEKQKKRRKNVVESEPEIIIVEDHTMNARPDTEVAQVSIQPDQPEPKVEEEVKVVQVSQTVVDTSSEVERKQEPEISTATEPEVKPTAPVEDNSKVEAFEKPPLQLNGRRVMPIRHEHRIEVASQKLTFKVWDDQVVDGDIISLYVNNVEIISKYSLTATQKVIDFDASGLEKCYIFLHAHNLGKIPPNSVTMSISDGETTHKVSLRSDLKGSAAIELMFD